MNLWTNTQKRLETTIFHYLIKTQKDGKAICNYFSKSLLFYVLWMQHVWSSYRTFLRGGLRNCRSNPWSWISKAVAWRLSNGGMPQTSNLGGFSFTYEKLWLSIVNVGNPIINLRSLSHIGFRQKKIRKPGNPYIWWKPWFTVDFPFNQSSDWGFIESISDENGDSFVHHWVCHIHRGWLNQTSIGFSQPEWGFSRFFLEMGYTVSPKEPVGRCENNKPSHQLWWCPIFRQLISHIIWFCPGKHRASLCIYNII